MLVLYETAAGYCLFKVLEKLPEGEDVFKHFETSDKANKA
jgi:hypothetical protein